jgi:membrane-bound lytic murein transglycosylase D
MMKRLVLLGSLMCFVVGGCAPTNSSHKGQWRTKKDASARAWKRVYKNKSHPKLGKIPRSDVPLQVNHRVLHWVEYFTKNEWNRARFARYLQRSGRYIELMHAALERHGMPKDLVYIALIESGFRNDARSHAAAVGTWQFIRSTGRGYGLDIGPYVDERRDPEKAVDAAARYLKNLYNEFGDWYLAMAGYNAGEGRVRRAIRRYGTTNFWQLASHRGAFRQETRDYVPKYIAATILAKSPERYGFRGVQYDEPLEYDTAKIRGQTSLHAVADAARVSVSTIEALNPELHAGVTPPGKYELNLPVGKASTFKRRFPKVARKYRVQTEKSVRYRVRRGDTLSRIAQRHGVSTRKLMAANGIRSARRLRAGKMLRIPTTQVRNVSSHARVLAVASTKGIAGRDQTRVAQADMSPVIERPVAAKPLVQRKSVAAVAPAVTAKSKTASVSNATYRVQPGDSLYVIARAHGMTVRELKRRNGLKHNRIKVGQRLSLGPQAKTARRKTVVAKAQEKPSGKFSTYTISTGDTLGEIAERHDMSVSELRRVNRLGRRAKIRAGKKLKVRGAAKPRAIAKIAAPKPIESLWSDRVSLAAAEQPRTREVIHRVKKGDTLWDLSLLYKVSPEQIQSWNKLSRVSIKPGQSLTIRTSS